MKSVASLFLVLFFALVHYCHAQKSSLIGTWYLYAIDSTKIYLAIPDSLKSNETVGYPVSSFIVDSYVFHADSTFDWYAGLMDVEIGGSGTWKMSSDTLYLNEEIIGSMQFSVRMISEEKMEWKRTSLINGEVQVLYYFLER